jgi:hypothetical protein
VGMLLSAALLFGHSSFGFGFGSNFEFRHSNLADAAPRWTS